jgi:hypothetical protein
MCTDVAEQRDGILLPDQVALRAADPDTGIKLQYYRGEGKFQYLSRFEAFQETGIVASSNPVLSLSGYLNSTVARFEEPPEEVTNRAVDKGEDGKMHITTNHTSPLFSVICN